MDLIANIPLIGGLLATVLPFILVLGIVVFIHEFGHYIVGRWCGIHAEVFSLGFGKTIASRVDSRGTVWQVCVLPLGGYVKFLGDADGASRPDRTVVDGMDADTLSRSFPGAAVWKRSLTVAAGPMANFILSSVIYFGLILNTGIAVNEPRLGPIPESMQAETPLQQGDVIVSMNGQGFETFGDMAQFIATLPSGDDIDVVVARNGDTLAFTSPYPQPPLIVGIRPLSAASRAGLRSGDLILSAGGTPTPDFQSLKDKVMASEGEELIIDIRRGADELTLTMIPTEEDVPQADGSFGRQVIIGVSIRGYLDPATETPGLFEAAKLGVFQTGSVISGSLDGIKQMIVGAISPSNLQGPVGIAQISGESASQGGFEFIMLIALISTAIGLMNLFPIPVLDGGHLVFYAIEAITGKQPKGRWVDMAMAVGIAMVLSLMLFATYNDITRL